MLTVALLCFAACFATSSEGIRVSNVEELKNAVTNAKPGDVIDVEPGIYKTTIKFNKKKGTANKPITLRGDCNQRGNNCNVTLDGGDVDSGVIVHVLDSSHVSVLGFILKKGKNAILVEGSTFCDLSGLIIENIGAEAIQVRNSSSDNILRGLIIKNTGLSKPGYGGVYIGSSHDQWKNGKRDACDRNKITGTIIGGNVKGINLDIKEGTQDGVISGNIFDGNGLTDTNSDNTCLSLKGNNYLVSGNVVNNAMKNGMETRIALKGWGEGNVFRANVANGGTGYGFYLEEGGTKPNTIDISNVGSGAAKGMTNKKLPWPFSSW